MTNANEKGPSFVRGLTLLGAVALIVGNMVGTSIYTLPASLAKEVGPLGLVAWVVTAAGYLFVALVYARLGTSMPRTGGPYVFARAAFGDFTAFQVVWSYWFSAVIGNAAIAFGVVGYVAGFSRELEQSPVAQFGVAQLILWGLCAVNVLGVKHSSRLQIVILFANVVPLVVIALLALPSFDAANLQPFAPHGWSALPLGVSLIVWAYSGIESATVPAEEVEAAESTIRRSTMIGYVIGTAVFLLAALAVAGVLPNDVAASSARPIALAAERTVGPFGGYVIAIVAIAAGLGTLNGWILMAGRIPVSAASDGLFFRSFGRIHPRFHTPALSLVLGTLIASAMLTLVLQKSLLDAFGWIVQLALLTTLVPHLVVAAADFVIARRASPPLERSKMRRVTITACLAFLFVAFAIWGLGAETWMWGSLVFVVGVPLYFVLKRGSRAQN
ncbi:MAG: amino acid permease [Planctomycetota bacterium]|mgnify:CR=1 FL=1|nr:amino acid permease [Planctomycetota bacterium]